MLTLYHADTAVCAAKVRVVLAEKSIGWEGRLINLGAGDQFAPDYMKLNPNAVVPTLVHDAYRVAADLEAYGVPVSIMDVATTFTALHPATRVRAAR